ncbi:5'-methylthioribose kinase [Rubellimicrobium thermophilum DSM 16684]|uniref:S-methyl-5-thioribose kinase n=1 Tax=Rubellimicrobium thermophilum DSM 16684 TaxID=1123069 RepID=S9QU46_9RHOB|nr:S-methyl-5-thioribose kinase [Rubellimicrobium thermophilum]EPX83158.1 5'-methylthioribose kinase [Rubellimicrobium thermophilum DSM 16684]
MEERPYEALTVETLARRLGDLPALRDRIGDPAGWRVREVGDGNLNLVFIVEGDRGGLVVKQALPYVRLVGESWPLPLRRSFFEYHALRRQQARDPGSVPDVLHFDEGQALVVMEYLDGHIILRRALIAGTRHAGLGERLGLFCARTLFRGSDLHLPAAERKADLALFAGNVDLCAITEALVFTEPYFAAPMNRHTPGLDPIAAELRADAALKLAAQRLKTAFAARAETLLHGDLHTGSVMVRGDQVRIIDPEFAVYGPMGFDIGMLIANFLMAHCAQPGHGRDRADYQAWILSVIRAIWTSFAAEFARLWRTERTGMLFPRTLFEDQGQSWAADAACSGWLGQVWRDTLGFAGLECHRRILGLAHNADFESIADEGLRAACEAKALVLGRTLLLGQDDIAGIDALIDLARDIAERDWL